LPKDSTETKQQKNQENTFPITKALKIPAIISPITVGCPIFLKTQPKAEPQG
jgi:hypothetical protein